MVARVLVVEDHQPLARTLTSALREEGHVVRVSTDGGRALALLREEAFDLALVDWMLPGLSGLELVTQARAAGLELPILFLTAKDGVESRVLALDAGADDYLVKPFALDELFARVRVLLRRRKGETASIVALADLHVDTRLRRASRGGADLDLSAREYALLEILIHNRGRVMSRGQLLSALYGSEVETKSNVIDVFVGQLRKKIDHGFEPKLLHTRRGLGYVLGVAE